MGMTTVEKILARASGRTHMTVGEVVEPRARRHLEAFGDAR